MNFWQLFLAVMLGNAAYDLAWMLLAPEEGDDDDDDYAGA